MRTELGTSLGGPAAASSIASDNRFQKVHKPKAITLSRVGSSAEVGMGTSAKFPDRAKAQISSFGPKT
eukprot:1155987-Pelagomonas_calceolata.AAC.11